MVEKIDDEFSVGVEFHPQIAGMWITMDETMQKYHF